MAKTKIEWATHSWNPRYRVALQYPKAAKIAMPGVWLSGLQAGAAILLLILWRRFIRRGWTNHSAGKASQGICLQYGGFVP